MENGDTVSTLERCEGRLIREHLQLHLETARIAESAAWNTCGLFTATGSLDGGSALANPGVRARERSPAAAATEVASSEGLRRDIWALL
jgi:hypothetical protein